ncbi:MAG: DNA-directed RNA polymerase subunit omega [Clostridia bacterium]|jgi:DNA-directed RNA polymerase omega subunit|nr:DNA-directed RNA polymerase subunit omega [Clostridia bacterium]MBO7158588.1 DNA-directed RNA polymerase subunit omega [Clostridia bacterium]MBQ1254403.1 DNA-directed RNA polymerase subunit omega [Clostridia bacterium]MBQ2254742.1 DNA-directed RNA polymerase subunit omega [Clostridia bacterium]MBQ5791584.1 DNA-directed RNA polymerase subunit omega [Clostridia bacterium]
MLYPSIQQLTGGEINRYRLVIASAKCARHVTDKMIEEREFAEKHKDSDIPTKDSFASYEVRKPVSIALKKLAEGEYTINEKDD